MFKSFAKTVSPFNPNEIFRRAYSDGFTCDNSSNYGELASTAIDFSSFSLGAWIKTTGTLTGTSSDNFGVWGCLEGSPVNSSGIGFFVQRTSANTLQVFKGDPVTPSFVCNGNTTIPHDEYFFAGLAFNGLQFKVYLNGYLDGIGNATITDNGLVRVIGDIYSNNSNLNFRLGGEYNQFFAVDDVLTDTDFQRIYNYGKGLRFEGLTGKETWYQNIATWQDFEAGSLGTDKSTNGNNITLF